LYVRVHAGSRTCGCTRVPVEGESTSARVNRGLSSLVRVGPVKPSQQFYSSNGRDLVVIGAPRRTTQGLSEFSVTVKFTLSTPVVVLQPKFDWAGHIFREPVRGTAFLIIPPRRFCFRIPFWKSWSHSLIDLSVVSKNLNTF
jgi:hypothetical protein